MNVSSAFVRLAQRKNFSFFATESNAERVRVTYILRAYEFQIHLDGG